MKDYQIESGLDKHNNQTNLFEFLFNWDSGCTVFKAFIVTNCTFV
jgi:hypothetical protein